MQKQMYHEKVRNLIQFLKRNDIAVVVWVKRNRSTGRSNLKGEFRKDIHKVFDKMREPK